MLNNHAAYKYETPYKGQFLKTQCQTNGMVALQCGETKIVYNMCCINPHTPDTKVEDIHFEN